MADPQTQTPPLVLRLTRGALGLFLAVAFVDGLAAGVHWRDEIAAWLGLQREFSSEAAGGPPALLQLWRCEEHPQQVQGGPATCPLCGRPLVRPVAYWWDPTLNPPFVSEQPGKSSTGRTLVPVYEDELFGLGPGHIGPLGGG